MSRTIALDIETDSLDANRIWCIVARDVTGGDHHVFVHPDKIESERDKYLDLMSSVDKVVMHNGIGFDWKVLCRYFGEDHLPFNKVIDTLIISRLLKYDRKGGHSLDAWGKEVGLFKGQFKDFEGGLSDEMLSYCKNDVDVTIKVYTRLLKEITRSGGMETWAKPIRLEHDIQRILEKSTENGFLFKADAAEDMLQEITDRMSHLEEEFQRDFPPKLEIVNTLQYKLKADGTPHIRVANAMEKYPKTEIIEDTLVCYDYIAFAPGSPKKRLDRLWESGWKPVAKTDGHIQWEKDIKNARRNKEDTEDLLAKEAKFKRYGWKCNEQNLNTLPANAPRGAHKLAEWMTLDGRRSSLVEWLGQVKDDGRIHGRFTGIGSWTHRLSHSAPNQANIPAEFHGNADTAVKKVKAKYDGPMRALWCVPEGSWQVGTDAEGIQLRLLAHFMKSEQYRDAILSGRKEDETDIHNLNRRALVLDHITRDDAKTFIYAFLLGAGNAKIGEILSCSTTQAIEAVDNFTQSIDGLAKLKQSTIPKLARRGWFQGLDKRRVHFPGEHYILAGMLQNGESTLMKHACIKWMEDADREGINYKLLTWPHDEWQVEVEGSRDMAERLGQIQRDAIVWAGDYLNLFCPMEGSTDIGKDWRQCH